VAQIVYPASDVTIGIGWVVPVAYKSSTSGSGTSVTLPTHASGRPSAAAQPPLLSRCATG